MNELPRCGFGHETRDKLFKMMSSGVLSLPDWGPTPDIVLQSRAGWEKLAQCDTVSLPLEKFRLQDFLSVR